MARIRTIKPEFWRHEGLSALPESTHMLAAALLNYADDHGYFNANPKLIQAECCPLREPLVSIPESLVSLQAAGYVRLGSHGGRRYGHIVEFSKHQRVAHPTDSKIKIIPITWDDNSNPHENFGRPPETFRPEQGTGNREQGNGMEGEKESAREAARAEILPPELIPDPRKAIFDDGLRWLAKATERSRDKLRPLVAKWCHARGDPEVAAAFVAAQLANPVDPIAWIEARLKSNGQRKPSDLQRRRSLAEAFLDVPVGDAEAGGAASDQAASGQAVARVS